MMGSRRSIETLPGQMMIIHFHNGAANGRLFRRYQASEKTLYRAILLDDGEMEVEIIEDNKTRTIEFFNTESWDSVRAIFPRQANEEE